MINDGNELQFLIKKNKKIKKLNRKNISSIYQSSGKIVAKPVILLLRKIELAIKQLGNI